MFKPPIKVCERCKTESKGKQEINKIRSVCVMSQFPLYEYGSCHLCFDCWKDMKTTLINFLEGVEQ